MNARQEHTLTKTSAHTHTHTCAIYSRQKIRGKKGHGTWTIYETAFCIQRCKLRIKIYLCIPLPPPLHPSYTNCTNFGLANLNTNDYSPNDPGKASFFSFSETQWYFFCLCIFINIDVQIHTRSKHVLRLIIHHQDNNRTKDNWGYEDFCLSDQVEMRLNSIV